MYEINGLPEKLSELLTAAVDDATAIQSNPKYRLDMNRWHYNESPTAPCYVCMAGAIIATRSNADVTDNVGPLSFGHDDVARRLFVVNEMRLGYFVSPYYKLNAAPLTSVQFAELSDLENYVIPKIDKDTRRASWEVYREAAKRIAAIGL